MGNAKLYTLFGKTQSLKQWAAEYKMKRSTLYDRLAKGMDLHTALLTPTDRKDRVTVWDETRTVDQWAQAANISRRGFYSRRWRGWAPEEMVLPRVIKRPGLTAFNKTQSYAAWAEEKGIPRATIYWRVNIAKMAPEAALTLPVDEDRRPRALRGRTGVVE